MSLPVEHGARAAATPAGAPPAAVARPAPGAAGVPPTGVGPAAPGPGAPVSAARPRVIERSADGVWLVVAGEARALKVVGPGRRERGWREEVGRLDRRLEQAGRELETARLVERGSQRLLDRVEEELVRERGELGRLRQAQARLVLAMGALQRENEALRGRVALLDAPPRRRAWWARLLGR
jgi:hypothetical protein